MTATDREYSKGMSIRIGTFKKPSYQSIKDLCQQAVHVFGWFRGRHKVFTVTTRPILRWAESAVTKLPILPPEIRDPIFDLATRVPYTLVPEIYEQSLDVKETTALTLKAAEGGTANDPNKEVQTILQRLSKTRSSIARYTWRVSQNARLYYCQGAIDTAWLGMQLASSIAAKISAKEIPAAAEGVTDFWPGFGCVPDTLKDVVQSDRIITAAILSENIANATSSSVITIQATKLDYHRIENREQIPLVIFYTEGIFVQLLHNNFGGELEGTCKKLPDVGRVHELENTEHGHFRSSGVRGIGRVHDK
ncbi:hypothetical protein BKA83DRAFT_4513331 [Pisolithus microcarpus]|nr:hypothetical protein BKA83DRAFT_4513331 [Pisolithus microcarpus]